MQSDVFDATGLGKLCRLDCVDRVVVKASANLDRQRNLDRFLDLIENRFQPLDGPSTNPNHRHASRPSAPDSHS